MLYVSIISCSVYMSYIAERPPFDDELITRFTESCLIVSSRGSVFAGEWIVALLEPPIILEIKCFKIMQYKYICLQDSYGTHYAVFTN